MYTNQKQRWEIPCSSHYHKNHQKFSSLTQFNKDVHKKKLDYTNDNHSAYECCCGNYTIYHLNLTHMNTQMENNVQEEISILKKFNQQNVVKLLNEFKDEKNKYWGIIVQRGKYNLKEYMKENKNIDEIKAVKIIKQILEACDQVREKGIWHKNIKPDNIILDKYNNIKLSNFLGKKIIEPPRQKLCWNDIMNDNNFYEYPQYLKLSKYQNNLTRKNVWSLGIILYELISGEIPNHNQNILETNNLNMKQISNETKKLINTMLSKQQTRPLSFQFLIYLCKQTLKQLENNKYKAMSPEKQYSQKTYKTNSLLTKKTAQSIQSYSPQSMITQFQNNIQIPTSKQSKLGTEYKQNFEYLYHKPKNYITAYKSEINLPSSHNFRQNIHFSRINQSSQKNIQNQLLKNIPQRSQFQRKRDIGLQQIIQSRYKNVKSFQSEEIQGLSNNVGYFYYKSVTAFGNGEKLSDKFMRLLPGLKLVECQTFDPYLEIYPSKSMEFIMKKSYIITR